ncbi:MAG TPA: glutaredoxin domain-containing protein [Solirubrobacteraceae bacterium]|jgi:glutaredoxin 3|nr:glutaredoxin domain-containing protein [Solirubrobacteraceae bacterium]
MKDIIVYTTDPCPYCSRVKGLLRSKGLEFKEINLSRDPGGRLELAQRTGMMTFPQVIIGDQLLGGFEQTHAAASNGRLDDLLAA